mmetsp:Transcript_14326/g.32592  ORF Transcript_14326/g.32592 Transcript_14326/m.32592 type:complete len:606 (-) Transcript_14326:253-2070(-)
MGQQVCKPCCASGNDFTDTTGRTGPERVLARQTTDKFSEVQRHFPMMVVGIDTILLSDLFPSFGRLDRLGKLHTEQPWFPVHFVSHQWLGMQHPDPDATQLKRLQNVWRAFLSGDAKTLFHGADFDTFLRGVSSRSTVQLHQSEMTTSSSLDEELVIDKVRFGWAWIDFCSVPQLVDVQDPTYTEEHLATQMAAIKSIPSYVERADFFWVLAPNAKHRDTGANCNFNTWRNRGWCRLEEWTNNLAQRRKSPMVITAKPFISTVGMVDYLASVTGHEERSVCAGDFSCCKMNHKVKHTNGEEVAIPCDKMQITEVLDHLFEKKLSETTDSFMYRFWLGVRRAIFSGSYVYERDFDPAETVADFLRKVGMENVSETDSTLNFNASWPACILAHPRLIKRMQEADPNFLFHISKTKFTPLMGLAIHYEDNVLTEMLAAVPALANPELVNAATGLGYTALSLASAGFPHNVKLLLELRANPNHADKGGQTPLHCACKSNDKQSVELLLQHGADVNAADLHGRMPLHLAADGVTLMGLADDMVKVEVIAKLVHARANCEAQDDHHRTPLMIATESGFEDAVFALNKAMPHSASSSTGIMRQEGTAQSVDP